jgi:hypothetical protein
VPETRPSRRWSLGLLALWAVAVPVAAVLGVVALRAAGTGAAGTSIVSAAEAADLASGSQPGATSAPEPTAVVVERRVPGAVLGLSCGQQVPTLQWAVPDPGWVVEGSEADGSVLEVRLESDEAEARVSVVCRAGAPVVVGADRRDD